MLRRLFGPRSKEVVSALRHRPVRKHDCERLRWTDDGSFVLPRYNPGLRVEPDFVSVEESELLAGEIRDAAREYGYEFDGDSRAAILDVDGSVDSMKEGVVNNVRVTGRLERPDLPQRLPPWGHGDAFDAAALPPALGRLVSTISNCGHFAVGAPRDLTINVRDHSFFQLDPHLDPESDGPDVFILGLESSAVLTFTPPDQVLAAANAAPRRVDPHGVGMRSWTDLDVDALVQPRTLLHFTGDARYTWKHAIRAGVQVDQPAAHDGTVQTAAICDWWGKTDYLVRRSQQRLSVVVAFGPPVAIEA